MTPRQSGIASPARHTVAPVLKPGCLRVVMILATLSLVLAVSSCGKHRVPVLPLTFNPAAAPPDPMEPPEITPELAEATPVALVIPPARPARPVTRSTDAAAAPLSTEPASPKPAPPRISMRLSPAEESSYRRQTNRAIAVAEKNLQSISSSTLSVEQQDLVEKIRGFLSQSREAIRSGDWLRAHSLAQKAQVLSEELISLK